MKQDEVFLKHLIEVFKVEADEHLKTIALKLVSLEMAEQALEETESIEIIFREAHSLKGAARAVNLVDVEMICHAVECIFSQMKNKLLPLTTHIFDLLQESVDFLTRRVSNLDRALSENEQAIEMDLIERLEMLKPITELASESEVDFVIETQKSEMKESMDTAIHVASDEPQASLKGEIAPIQSDVRSHNVTKPIISEETLRVSSTRLTSVLLQSEELLSAKQSAIQQVIEIKNIRTAYAKWKKEWTILMPVLQEVRNSLRDAEGQESETAKMRSVLKLMEFVDWNNHFIRSSESAVNSLLKTAQRDSQALDGMIDALMDDMKKVMLFPFSFLLEMMPKLVRDLAKDSGRQAILEIKGDEIEIDRRILEELREPMIHLVRNCMDHGIEKPEEREKKGKPINGKILIEIIPRDYMVELVITDDGAGIAADSVRSSLEKSGVLPQEQIETLTDRELISYVFFSGVSTSPIITELSGRGLGLSIVQEKVEKLGGSITVETQTNLGTKFHIVLPLTIANFRGILITSGNQEFILPTKYVERVVRIKSKEIKMIENREVIIQDGAPISLVRLSAVLGIKEAVAPLEGFLHLLVLTSNGIRIAFLVDQIHYEQEVLFKVLGPQLAQVRNISGATVLASGQTVLILSVPNLLNSAIKSSSSLTRLQIAGAVSMTEEIKLSVLVVEDSITTRTFLKNIMETSGYLVQTATDGIDALSKLKNSTFDLVLSDVDMPGMNGFDLTEKIRGDDKTKTLPVILITALASREDQERGIDVGASAYIIKSMFDQSNLLDVVKRLIGTEAR